MSSNFLEELIKTTDGVRREDETIVDVVRRIMGANERLQLTELSIQQTVLGVQAYAIEHHLLIGECCAWNRLKETTRVQ